MAARKILAILESRATYGYSKNVMQVLATRPALELMTLVTGMHLMPELGSSVRLIEEDGFPISTRVPLAPEDDTASAWPKTMGKAMAGFAEAMGELEPDIVLLFGDRAETFMACIAASYMSVPTAHIQAGDKSGHVDDIARMALAKLVNIHFPSCEDSAERLRRLGEQEFRIHNVGAPQLDNIVGTDFSTDAISIDATDHDLSKPYILVVQHSVLVERGEIGAQIQSTIDAVNGVHMPVFWIYPNSDAGFREIIARLEEADSGGRIKFVQNVERNKFLSLLANCAVLVGNSSSGILEAPSFKIPVVNIGNRQRGRPQASNLINCSHDAADISRAIEKALKDREFKAACQSAVNPYGDGKSAARICDVLETVKLDQDLIDKQTIY